MSSNICGLKSQGISSTCSFRLCPGQSEINHAGLSVCTTSSCPTTMGQTIRGGYLGSCCSKQRGDIRLFSSVVPRRRHLEISLACQSMNMRLLVPKPKILPKVKCNVGAITWPSGCSENENKRDDCNESYVKFSHGKKVCTDYSVMGMPGDGRCLFRSVAHGACLRSEKPPSGERLQRELADELRRRVANEFIKRREETEWMPITVYMYDQDVGGLISIAEYGQEYAKENPIGVLYHGFGHYDELEIPRSKGPKP